MSDHTPVVMLASAGAAPAYVKVYCGSTLQNAYRDAAGVWRCECCLAPVKVAW